MAVDEESDELVENGTMEQLAALVLTGEGHRLVGRQSSNPELQAFIDNVPNYMSKIRAVHKAAREGSLKDLQISLDRRKFAIAKDPSSPHGATALHVAVIFGHTPIIRYLAGRFPETAHALDLDGRTPLHYAATLADNGHYYNLLLHFGANPLVQDNFGQKADFYKKNQDDLSHKQLLRDFGAAESFADEMLQDKVPGGDTSSARRDVTEPETLATLERCFRLLTSGIVAGGPRGSGGTSGSTNSGSGRRVSVPGSSSANTTAGTLLGRCMRRQVFETVKHRVTCMDHNLFDVIWPALRKYSQAYASNTSLDGNHNVRERRLSVSSFDEDFTGNVVAPDFESYVVFAELLDPLIRDLHCVTVTGKLPDQPSPRFFLEDDAPPTPNSDPSVRETISMLQERDLDSSRKYVMAGVVECTRNFSEFQLPLIMRIKDLEESERIVTSVLMGSELSNIMAEGSSEDEPGTYYTLSEIIDPDNEVRDKLAASGLLLPVTECENSDDRKLHGRHWPYGRGVYVSAAGDVAVWVNVLDHIRVISCTSEEKPGRVGRAYVRLASVVAIFDKYLEFVRDQKLGFLTARPHAIGNTLRFDLIVRLVGLSKKPEDLKNLCVVRGLRIHPTLRKDTVRLGNQQSLSIGEFQTYQDFDRAVTNVLTLEKEMALNSSLKIATVIANIFKKRRFSDEKIFQDEEGRYLASSLGDPLIKGLTEVATTRPKDPVTYLASYLYNFANQDKPKDEQEDSNILIIPEKRENGPEENLAVDNQVQETENDDGYPQSPDLDAPESLFNETERDENGQSSLHLAANRSHSKDGLYHFLQERQINIAYRDSRYRTARDVAEQSRNRENVQEIDRFVVYLAARGETDKLVELLMEGYDHILDTEDDEKNILEIAQEEDNQSTVKFLQSIQNYTELRDDIHSAIRSGDSLKVRELLEMNGDGARLLALGKNTTGRCSLHIAVLREHPDIVRYIAKTYPETLRIGDNLERTPLHYAMGVPSVESLSNILIKAGAKRVQKDLRSRQPTYYFMNKTDIKNLQDEEASVDN